MKESLENDSNLPIKVNHKPVKPDILIVEARESLKKKRSESDNRYVGLIYGRYKGVVETKSNELRIRVSTSNVGRALHFFDALIKLLRVSQLLFEQILWGYGLYVQLSVEIR